MELEVGQGQTEVYAEFNLEAVRLIMDRGYRQHDSRD
jgi:hypothetical protein